MLTAAAFVAGIVLGFVIGRVPRKDALHKFYERWARASTRPRL